MKPSDADAAQALQDFARLPGPDRRAIERRLTKSERFSLKRLLKGHARSDGLSSYSPWLSKRLTRLSAPDAPALTDATQNALRKLRALPAPEPSYARDPDGDLQR